MTKSEIDMTDGALLPSMLRFAIPLMAASVLQLLFNASDIAVLGNFGSTHSLAAVGSTVALISLLTNFFIGMSIGTNVLASRCLGAQNYKYLRRVVHTSLALGGIAGVFMAAINYTGYVFFRADFGFDANARKRFAVVRFVYEDLLFRHDSDGNL